MIFIAKRSNSVVHHVCNLLPRTISGEKSASPHLSQTEIGGDKPCSRQLSGRYAWGALVELKSPHTPRVPQSNCETHPVYCFEVVSTDCFVGFPLFAAFFST